MLGHFRRYRGIHNSYIDDRRNYGSVTRLARVDCTARRPWRNPSVSDRAMLGARSRLYTVASEYPDSDYSS
jgi:hypothetical protein